MKKKPMKSTQTKVTTKVSIAEKIGVLVMMAASLCLVVGLIIGLSVKQPPEGQICDPSLELCDAVDNDCDGQVDEGNVCEEVYDYQDFIVPGKFIVKFSSSAGVRTDIEPTTTGISSVDELNQKYSVTDIEKVFNTVEKVNTVGLDRIYTFYINEGADISSLVRDYQLDEHIEYAEPVLKPIPLQSFPDDPYYWSSGTYPGEEFMDQYWLHIINASNGWQYADGAGVIVAYTDQIDSSHPDLDEQLWINVDEIPDNGIDDDNNAYIDDYNGPCSTGGCTDTHGHGTAIAGVIAGETNNSEGIASIAFSSKLMPVLSWQEFFIKYAVENGAHIISHSWSGRSNYHEDLLEYAHDNGISIFVAAGNKNAYSTALGTLPTAINVAITDWNDNRNSSSGWGDTIDVAAPGINILTTGEMAGLPLGDGYTFVSGSSFSAPLTAGLAALLLSYDSSLTPDQIRYIILNSADDKGASGWDEYYGYGRINVSRAFDIVLSGDVPAWSFDSKITYPRYKQAVMYGQLDVRGTAVSPDFVNYEIELCDTGVSDPYDPFYDWNFSLTNCRVIATQSTSVSSGVLASLDTVELGLEPGYYYFLKLKVHDAVIPYYKPYITAFYLTGLDGADISGYLDNIMSQQFVPNRPNTITATVTNLGNQPATDCTVAVQYAKMNEQFQQIGTASLGTINAGESAQAQFIWRPSTVGWYVFKIIVYSPDDQDSFNNVGLKYPIVVVCVEEDLDSDGYFPCGDTTSIDCDDANPDINPGALEICQNNIDDNCNEVVDEWCTCESHGGFCAVVQNNNCPSSAGEQRYYVVVKLDHYCSWGSCCAPETPGFD